MDIDRENNNINPKLLNTGDTLLNGILFIVIFILIIISVVLFIGYKNRTKLIKSVKMMVGMNPAGMVANIIKNKN